MKKGEMLSKMLVLATNAHAGQFDRGGKPYILHPLAVLELANSDDEEIQKQIYNTIVISIVLRGFQKKIFREWRNTTCFFLKSNKNWERCEYL